MTISMFQCLLIGLWTAFCLAGMLFGIYTNRCLVMAAGVGLILGDLPTGLAMGAVGELAFMGFGVSQGGSVPPNPMGPGIVGTIIAITMKDSGIDVGSALALSFPFAVAFQFVITATYTFATTLTSYAYKALDKKNFRGFRIAANATVCVFAVVGFIIGFGGAFSSEGLQKVISLIPAWLSAGLGVAGKMLPAIGFAMILNVMAKKELIPFVLFGYIAIALALGFVAYGLSIFMYVRAQNVLGAAKTSAYYAVNPLIGALLAFVFLSESLSWTYVIALIVMIIGSALVVVDTLIRQHTHEHQHSFSHTHGGSTHTHTVWHSHVHKHYLTEENHIHRHSIKELESLAEEKRID